MFELSAGRKSRDSAFEGVQPFRLEGAPVRGRLVRLGATLERVLANRAYPEPVARLLAESLVLAAMLSRAIKYDGMFILEARGEGPVRLVVVDVASDGAMRGYAQYDAAGLADARAGCAGAPVPLPRLLGRGQLVFTVDQGSETERYQGVAELDGASLADCAHDYFRRSEQIETAIKLAATPAGAGGWRAGGLMMQRMPEAHAGFDEATEDGEAWRRMVALMSSATGPELLDPALGARDLLFRLFHEDGVWVHRPQPLRFGCHCSRARVAAMLRALPRDEIVGLEIDGRVVVTCEFCHGVEVFDDAQLDALYAA